VRQRGYALDKGEHESDVRCVAAPIYDRQGRVVAAVSVSGPKNRMEPLESNEELIAGTLQAVRRISVNLGFQESGLSI
jgi:DNA-binding IclR family transcriptional regulator